VKQQNRKWVLVAVLVATFLSAIEGTIVSTAMPSIINDLNGMKLVNLIFSIYLLIAAITTPIYGKLADLYGRKRVLIFAIILFLIGSALCGMAQSMLQLVLFRAVQGLGAGAVLPITSTIIGDIYTTEERTRMQALFSGVWAVSGVIGPLLGGFIVEAINWRWIFYINLPFGIVSLLLLSTTFHENVQRKEREPIDWSGATLFLLSVGSLLYVLLFGKDQGFVHPVNLALIAIFAVSLLLFIRVERSAQDPFFPLDLMRNKLVLIPNLFGFFGFSFMIATTVYIPIWIQNILHGSPTESGFALTFMSFGWPLGAILNARLIRRFGPWNVTTFGAILLVASASLLASINVGSPAAIFFIVMFFAGVAFGLCTTVFTIILQNAVEWKQRGVAMGSNALMNTLGQTIFIAVFGAVFNMVTSGQPIEESTPLGIRTVFLCVVGVTVISLFIALRFPKITREEMFRDSRLKSAEEPS
jgi:EmrB/QacA subfamily drug resistance transporter